MESAPRNVQVRPLSSSTMVITWEPPETPNGQVTGYKVYYTTNPNQPEASWDSQMVDNSELTTISELTPHAIYTVRVQAYTSMGAGPMSTPVQVKTQQGFTAPALTGRCTEMLDCLQNKRQRAQFPFGRILFKTELMSWKSSTALYKILKEGLWPIHLGLWKQCLQSNNESQHLVGRRQESGHVQM
ncbi:hypothetical protein GQX74_000948 [Glossina fuscipes]|nr:hypothetical protein GQX74_000948 [Glossina fuscipes]